jgi:ABC-type multidrug transport system fused ATPase/permease subunit
MSDTLAVILFLVLPLSVPVLGIQFLNWRARRRPSAAVRYYSMSIGGSKVVVSGQALAKILLVVIPLYFFGSLVFLSLPLLILLLAWLVFFSTKRSAPSATSEATQSVLEALRKTTQQVESARVHLESLAADVQARQVEVEESERLHENLRKEIEHKLKEVDAWRALTEDQKSVFIGAAREALQKTSTVRIATVALWSVALNIVASAAWSLMGSPGQTELQQLFQKFQSLLGI